MAENDDGQERSEEPTAKRLREAREKGQVPRSRELASMTMLMAASVGLLTMGHGMAGHLESLLTRGFSLERTLAFDKHAAMAFVVKLLSDGVWMLVPFLLLLLVASFLPPIVMGGLVFSWEAASPKWSKLDPLKGLQRMFGLKALMELVKGLAKFAVVALVAWVVLSHWVGQFVGLGREPLHQALAHAASLVLWSFLYMSSALILIALVDVPFQLWDHNRQLKMTRQEIRDEYKETEGKPEVKSRIRRLQYEMSQRRMMEEVPKADVVVTNPTHYSVALRYDQEGGGAPRVVAKGVDIIAMQIRTIARGNDVPLFTAPPLARAIYYNCELDQEIPAGLYVAVAQVLAYVYQVRTILRDGGAPPPPPSDLPVPDELLKRDRERGAGEVH